jgi:hypothetical protein
MDWFEILTGFRETDYDDTRARLKVEGTRLRSLVNDKAMASETRNWCRCNPCAKG